MNAQLRKLPIGIQTFENIRREGYVYVDKTALIYRLVTTGKPYFLSRPRRFGKSLLLSTLESYFEGRRELFEGLAIADLEEAWQEYPVLHLDLNAEKYDAPEQLGGILNRHLNQWEDRWGREEREESFSDRFSGIIRRACEQTGQPMVVLVDEYDKPLLDVMDSGLRMKDGNGNEVLIEDHNRGILKGFYSAFKAADAHLRFVLLTGVTKFSQVSVFSGFNQPKDISMDDNYEAICGISKAELLENLMQPVGELAEVYDMDTDKMVELLEEQYDGYHFSSGMTDMFNPFSLLNAFDKRRLDSFWFSTGTPTYLIRLLQHNHENLNDLTGRYYRPADFVDYKADAENPLAMIYQSGYLTIKGFNRRFNTFLLDFPNKEVKEGFVSLVANNYLQVSRDTAVEAMEWVQTIEAGNLSLLRKQLTAFFASIPYTMRRKENERERERYFHYTFYLIFRLMSTYTILTEKRQSEGRADCIIETPAAVFIFEFKLDGTADEALRQIEEKGYARPYAADKRPVRKIGVVFSSQTGTIEEWKEV